VRTAFWSHGGGTKTVTYIWVATAMGGIAVAAIYALCAAAAAGDADLGRVVEQRASPPAAATDSVARLTPGLDRVVALAAQMLDADRAAVIGPGEPLPPTTETGAMASAPLGDGGEDDRRLVVVCTEPGRTFCGRELALLGTLADACAAVLDHPTEADPAAIAARVEAIALALGPQRAELRWRGGDFVALVAAVGRRLGLGPTEQAELELAARLLDLGMLRLPSSLVDRRGPLDDAERRLVHRHPSWGAEALLTVPGLAAVALLVLCHHERWDGTGYPHGLPEERVPIAARVLAGCDAWWSMTSERPFAGALDPEEAVDELVAASGAQLEPRVVDALLAEVAGVTLVV
jgi:hypothetical protein